MGISIKCVKLLVLQEILKKMVITVSSVLKNSNIKSTDIRMHFDLLLFDLTKMSHSVKCITPEHKLKYRLQRPVAVE
jgi:hypothetical protein